MSDLEHLIDISHHLVGALGEVRSRILSVNDSGELPNAWDALVGVGRDGMSQMFETLSRRVHGVPDMGLAVAAGEELHDLSGRLAESFGSQAGGERIETVRRALADALGELERAAGCRRQALGHATDALGLLIAVAEQIDGAVQAADAHDRYVDGAQREIANAELELGEWAAAQQ